MSYGVKLHVWGDYACFTRPEMKVERVSYDVMTPSAARGILEAVHWKPEIRWIIDQICVLNPIRFDNFRKNEVSRKLSSENAKKAFFSGDLSDLHIDVDEIRQQRAMRVLRHVSYVIAAHFEMTNKGNDDAPAKHYEIFRRRAEKGQCFHRPSLGLREFAANFAWIETVPTSTLEGSQDLGWMLYDIDFGRSCSPMFFHAKMIDGLLDISKAREAGLVR